jgi:hypothetical protein
LPVADWTHRVYSYSVGSRLERLKRALEVTQVAGHKRLLRVL